MKRLLPVCAVFALVVGFMVVQWPSNEAMAEMRIVMPSLAQADDGGGASPGFVAWLLDVGGVTMYFLVLVSVIGIAFVLERTFRLRRYRIMPKGLVDRCDELLRSGNYKEADELCQKRSSTIGRMIRFCIHNRDQSVKDLEVAAGEIGVNEMRLEMSAIQPISVVAAIAPLLGLLGTVIGMIKAFNDFQKFGEHGDPSVFAGSISMALVTTAAGLIVAMPAIIAYHFFRIRTQRMSIILANDFSTMLNNWKMKEGEVGLED